MLTYQAVEESDDAAAATMQTYQPSKEGEALLTDTYNTVASSVDGGGEQQQIVDTVELPPEVYAAALLHPKHHTVLAWTKFDPALADRIGNQACWSIFDFFMFVPCFWPHLLLIWTSNIQFENSIKSQYWIVTERELKVVIMDHATSCCSSSGNQIKSILLDAIADCGVNNVSNRCCKKCCKCCNSDLRTIYVETVNSSITAREAIRIGLTNDATFIRQILDQRDVVKFGRGGHDPLHTATTKVTSNTIHTAPIQMAIATIEPMQRGGAVDGRGLVTDDRIKQVQEL